MSRGTSGSRCGPYAKVAQLATRSIGAVKPRRECSEGYWGRDEEAVFDDEEGGVGVAGEEDG